MKKTTQTWPPSFTAADRAIFERFKIPANLVKDNVRRVTDAESRKELFLHAPAGCSLAGLAFFYPSPEDEGKFATCRVRRDKPDVVDGKTKNKYMSPKGGPRLLYRPPGAAERLCNPDTVIVLPEAEKSALALTAWAEREERSILALAMGGCWGWSQNKAPLPDLEVCRARRVYIMLDANAAANPDVQKARTALATALRKLDCDVLIADMPPDVNGPDDLLALDDGDSRMDAVLAAARPAVAAPHSEDALAVRFAEEQKDDLRYVEKWGRWFVWDGQRWKEDETGRVLERVAAMLEIVAGKECSKDSEAKRVRSANTIEKVVRLAGLHNRLAATIDQWDIDPMLLNTPSGTVNLRTRLLRPASREDYCTKMTAVAPNSEARPPRRWLQFLKEITKGDKQLQAYWQRVAGYSSTASTQEHAMFLLYGTGANGKSVFVNTIAGILGDYAKVAAVDTFTATPSPQHSTSLAALRGARLVIATETEEGSRWAEAKIKSITGGDRQTCRFLYHDEFTYTPQFKLMVSGNHKPRLRNVDEAIRRRTHLIPFDVTIPPEKRDPRLAETLRAEWGGILQWMIEGCVAWQHEGLRPPDAVTGATDEYMREQDAVRRWLEEETEADPNGKEQPSAFFHAYRRWADAAGEWVPSQIQFAQKLAVHGYESGKSHGARVIRGLRLLQTKPVGVSGTRKFAGGKTMMVN